MSLYPFSLLERCPGCGGRLKQVVHLDCDDEIIREGVRAMLAERQIETEPLAARREREGWTAYQIADRTAFDALRDGGANWAEYRDDPSRREAALARFHKYAYQWY